MNESLYKHCLIGKCVRRTAIIAALLLAACDQPDTTDLATLTIPGVTPYQYLDDPVISVSVSILTLSAALPRAERRPAARRHRQNRAGRTTTCRWRRRE